MKKIIIIVLIVVILGIGTFFLLHKKHDAMALQNTSTSPADPDSIKGCYLATIANDRYMLAITAVDGQMIEGSLEYDNYEKDSSKGTLTGSYFNDILTATYTFSSEGTTSKSEVVFKKTANGFTRGFGDTKIVGDEEDLVDVNNLSYDNSPEFVHTDDCTIPAVK